MAGRQIDVPVMIKKVAANGSSGGILLYTLADELMIARNGKISKGEAAYCTKHYCELSYIGSWFNTTGTRNNEEIVALQPDLIVSAGKVDSATVGIVNRDQKQMNIPMYLASTNIKKLPETYQQLGKLLDREEKAAELIAFYQKYVPNVMMQTAAMVESQKKRVYVAMDNDGLTTPSAGSLHSQVVELAGAVNVADLNMLNADIKAQSKVSIEQVITWNPEIILVAAYKNQSVNDFCNMLRTNPKWAGIRAVKEGNVIVVPTEPFMWIDRPPSVNQVIGLLWLAKTLYPERYDYQIDEVVQEFFKKFYHCQLTSGQVNHLLHASL